MKQFNLVDFKHFFYLVEGRIVAIEIDEKCETSAEYKDQLINLAKKYRSFELSK